MSNYGLAETFMIHIYVLMIVT